MKKLFLPHGLYALVDDEVYEWAKNYKWRLTGNGYVMTQLKRDANGHRRSPMLHRMIMNFPDKQIDHINRDKLDNRKSNLRLCTQTQNNANQRIRSDNKSGIRGVSFNKRSNKWAAYISVKGKTKNLGSFTQIEKAKEAYMKVAKEHFQEYLA